jgi:hypothetical protein
LSTSGIETLWKIESEKMTSAMPGAASSYGYFHLVDDSILPPDLKANLDQSTFLTQ